MKTICCAGAVNSAEDTDLTGAMRMAPGAKEAEGALEGAEVGVQATFC